VYPNRNNFSERSDLAILMPNNSELPKPDRFLRCKSVPEYDLRSAVKPTLRWGNLAMFMARVTEGAKSARRSFTRVAEGCRQWSYELAVSIEMLLSGNY
jgi:hypothetical protein